MLSKDHISLSDEILKYITENNNIVTEYDLHKYLHEKKYNRKDVLICISFLENDYMLIDKFSRHILVSDIDHYKITSNGINAQKNGIEKYIKSKEKETKKSKWPIIISIFALLISSIQPLISLYQIIFLE